MSRSWDIIRNNRLTFFMILFITLFYALTFFMERMERRSASVSKTEKSELIVSSKEIKDKESLFKKNIQGHPVFIIVTMLLFLMVLFCGFLTDVYLFNKRLKGIPLVSGGMLHETVTWGVKEVCQVFIFLFFMETVILLLEYLTGYFLDLRKFEKHLFLMLNSFLRDIAAAGFVIFLVTRCFGQKLSTIGLTTKNFIKNIQTGILGYVAVIPAILVVLFVLSAAAQKFSYEPPVQPVVQLYLKEKGGAALLFFTVFVAVVGPVIEEIFFRGFTYKAFRQRFGVWGALVATSVIFSGLHMSLIAFIPIFLLGFFLAYLYEQTGSLVPSMTAHMLHNLIMVSMTMVFKKFAG